jgi:cytochrome-b5 reductase
LLVKLYPEGRGSGYLHSLQPGDKLLFAASIPRPRWQPNAYRHVTLIAGGAGITPVFQLAQGILRGDPADRTAVTLVFGINSDRDVLLHDELNDLERRFPDRFRAVYTVSHPEPGSPYAEGYVTRELLEKVVPAGDKTDTAVYVCGPPAMEKALVGKSGILEQVGWSKSQVHQF